MRIPLVPDADSRDGTINKDARLTNMLAEKDSELMACVRPGLNQIANATGNGNGLVCFDGELINLYGSNVNKIITSLDWVTSDSPFNNGLGAMAHDGTQYLILGNNYSAVSTDGDGWYLSSLPYTGPQRVAWGNNVFSAIFYNALGNTMNAVSSNGFSWDVGVMNNSVVWRSIAYGGGIFVAVASSTDIANKSSNGSIWESTTLPISSSWLDIAHNGTVFCAVSGNSATAAVSSDGISWSSGTLPSSGWSSIASNGIGFCALNSTSNKTATSTDGIVWSSGGNLPASSTWTDLIWDGSRYIAVGGYSAKAGAYSIDGASWTTLAVSSNDFAYGAVSNGAGEILIYDSVSPTYKIHHYKTIYTPTSVGSLTDGPYDFALIP